MDVAFKIAECATVTLFEDLPREVVQATHGFIADSLAVAVAGASAAGVSAGVDYAREIGGAEQASLLVYGGKVPAPLAAMVNGTMMQARDFDAVYEPGVLLPYAPVIAASLATAELVGASGSDFLTAIILGADVTCRLGRSVTKGLGWSRTATLGVFGAVVASGRLQGLSRDQMVSALGLALSHSSGNIQTVIDGALAKRYQAGFAAEAGVKCAMLAKRDISGPVNVFEGPCGFFALYEGSSFDRERILECLRTDFEGVRASMKPFPCAREVHGAIAAALDLYARGVRVENIDSITVTLPPNAFALCGKRYPLNPSPAAAMGNAAYCVAVALTRGAVGLGDFEVDALKQPDVLAVIDRIVVEQDQSLDPRTLVPQYVSVALREGGVMDSLCSVMPGAPEHPMTDQQLQAKMAACFQSSHLHWGHNVIGSLQEAVAKLERCGDVQGLLNALVPQSNKAGSRA